ncbi:tumor necrosis factor ligand superfamily member 11 [Bombina bombina]|uniref:tumor necrosis factor ligand superfamily member 11 n=1 Tax=Bombina bombina TaxID=8345 RepID=UPI00235AA6B5|nr:tumor necrosis factor ligand superfamily member 11 [Bombina bombina]
MSPGGYQRAAEELGIAQMSGLDANRPRSLPRRVLLALIFLALAQVGCTLGLFLYFKQQMDPNRTSEKVLECWRTSLKKKEASDTNDPVSEDDKLKSCAFIGEALHATVNQVAQELIAEKPLQVNAVIPSSSPFSKNSRSGKWPVAHLTIANHTHSSQSKVTITSWNYREGWGNLLNMGYDNGKLKILQSGFYYVYANICFRHHEISGNAYRNKVLQLMLYISKMNSNRKQFETLMKGGSTPYWSNDTEYHFHSVHQGGVFKFVVGDEIFVQVSNAALLDLAQDATYFGAIKILDVEA